MGSTDGKNTIGNRAPAVDVDESTESSDEDEDYFSADASDEDGDNDQADSNWEAREKERQRVLEAAGLIVTQDAKPPSRLVRVRSARQRRPPPAAPQRNSAASQSSLTKDLPSVPERDNSPSSPVGSTRVDDAFDRYEAFERTRGTLANNRLSVASSFETAPSSPGESSPAISLAPSTSGEHRPYVNLLHFLGRKAPANETQVDLKKLTISGPIMDRPGSPARENSTSPAFGSVSHFHHLLNPDSDCNI